MFRCCRHRLALAVFAAGGLRAAEPQWPPLNGELSGALRLDALGDAPPLQWRTHLKPTAGGLPQIDLEVTASGLELHARATLPPGEAPGTWQISSAAVDLAMWLPIALARAGQAVLPPDLVATGTLRVAGEGTWRNAKATGSISAALDGATVGSTAQNLSASGVSLAAAIDLADNLPTVRSLRLGVDTLQMASLTARRIVAEAAGAEGGRIDVRRAELEVLGGRVALTPFTVDPARLAIDTAADLTGLALGELAALAPQALAEGSGQVAGRVAVRWSAEQGPEPGAGALRVAVDVPATVRLAPTPGFLTQRLPARFGLIGGSFGPLSRWLSIENPAYLTLRRIELGELPLAVDSLEVKLYPDGPDGAISARVELSGHPAEPHSPVGAVSFQVNVAGPLSQVVHYGLNNKASLHVNSTR